LGLKDLVVVVVVKMEGIAAFTIPAEIAFIIPVEMQFCRMDQHSVVMLHMEIWLVSPTSTGTEK
jgi:hypothetical protein